jgi:hypothetical protein
MGLGIRRNVVDLVLEIQALRDGSAKTRLHDANSGWMEFSERTPNARLVPWRRKFLSRGSFFELDVLKK